MVDSLSGNGGFCSLSCYGQRLFAKGIAHSRNVSFAILNNSFAKSNLCVMLGLRIDSVSLDTK